MIKILKNLFHNEPRVAEQPEREKEPILRKPLSKEEEKTIERAVERTIKEYGEALRKLGND